MGLKCLQNKMNTTFNKVILNYFYMHFFIEKYNELIISKVVEGVTLLIKLYKFSCPAKVVINMSCAVLRRHVNVLE